MDEMIFKKAAIDAITKALDREGILNRIVRSRAIRAVNTLPAVNRWIPCKERLPESYHNPVTMDYGLYLCSCDFGDGNIDVRAFKFGNGHFLLGGGIMDRYVTAWMPLPLPYKEEEDGTVD